MRAFAIIVTYNPSEGLEALVDSLCPQCSVIIVDNGSATGNEYLARAAARAERFTALEKNAGLAHAQNVGAKMALELGADVLCLFDQDTGCPENYIERMTEGLYKAKEQFKVGIFAPNYFDYNTGDFARYAVLTPSGYSHVDGVGTEGFLDVSFVIASGSIIEADVYRELGGFIDEYFIDCVDTEYCLRVLKAGYKIIVNLNCVLKHTIGRRTKHKLFGLVTVKPNHHPASRKYFIFRNGWRTVRDYKAAFPGFRVLMSARMIHDALGVIFYESGRWAKIGAMLRGLRDARKDMSQWTN